jgi:predicted metal-dependent HD superfamily phosphohydrolase
MTTMTPQLRTTWHNALGKKVDIGAAINEWDALIAHYNEPHRRYHSLSHLERLLDVSVLVPDSIKDTSFWMAVFYHDVIYDPRAADNEEKSAEHAAQALARLGFNKFAQHDVKQLILSTKTHTPLPPPLSEPSKYVLDADLAILGFAEEDYNEYACGIREEYAFVPDDDYRRERGKILARFSQRERLYYTKPFFENFEQQARYNIGRELASLR